MMIGTLPPTGPIEKSCTLSLIHIYCYLQGKGATMNDPIDAYDQRHGCYCYAPHQSGHRLSDLSGSFITLAPHEGIVDAACWLEAQRKLDRNRTLCSSGAGTHSWLSGLMKCQKCGYAITVVNKPAGMRGHYINCGGHKRGNAVCPGLSLIHISSVDAPIAPSRARLIILFPRCFIDDRSLSLQFLCFGLYTHLPVKS